MNKVVRLLAALAVLFAIGCGGGGGGGGSSSSSNGSFFITDNLIAGYDHVWVTIKQVSLGKVAGGSTVVFDNAAGVQVDLRSLRDNQGRRFKFLSCDNGLKGEYNSVSVTLDENVVLYPTAATSGLPRTFEGASGGLKLLTASFPARTFGSGNDDFIIDFDLSVWNDNGTQVTGAAIAAVAADNNFHDHERHDHENYPGTISDLQGTVPDQTFTLTRGNDSFQVQVDAETRIERTGGNGNPVLGNGQHVVVRGNFDPDTNALIAERLKITGNQGNDHDEAEGTVSNIVVDPGTFDLDVTEADGFIPAGNPIHIVTNGQTTFRNRTGAGISSADFFALLETDDNVEAEGVYNAETNTLTASKIKFEHDHDGGEGDEDNASVTGATSSAVLASHSFVIVATEFCGLNVAPGTLITVQTNGDTHFRGLGGGGEGGGSSMSEADFYAALTGSVGHLAEVEGHWDGSVLVARKCKLEND